MRFWGRAEGDEQLVASSKLFTGRVLEVCTIVTEKEIGFGKQS